MIPYILKRKDIKKLYLRIKDNQIVVSAPYFVSKQDVDQFVLKNSKWIDEHLKDKNFICDGDMISILNKKYCIKISKDVHIQNEIIFCHDKKSFYDCVYSLIAPIFLERFTYISNRLNYKDMHLKIRLYKSKWGSCTPSKQLICLNLNLAFSSIDCIDAILYHEFAHMQVLNHSKRFYDVVLRWMPNYKEVIKQLKTINIPEWEE